MSQIMPDTKAVYEMLLNGYNNLCLMEATVNDLNVFPVPDGDTGTNMVKTFGGGFGTNPGDFDSLGGFMASFSRNILLSARGNSGVILSQYIRGWALALSQKTELCPEDIGKMLRMGTESAYNAVPSPVEGTMLTVLREASEAFENAGELEDFKSIFAFILKTMKASVEKTPELLPVLKQANVVDSGGVGILYIFEGILAYFDGEIINCENARESTVVISEKNTFGPDSVLEYGYCTEFVLQLMNAKTNIAAFSVKDVISYLQSIGDSVVAVLDGDIVKVHVHTFMPEKALAFGRSYGEFISVKIENMSVQHSEVSSDEPKSDQRLKYAIVTVASGEGIKSYFAEIGANRIIDGGQTNNPSTKDFIDAFNSLNAEHIVVLPNNSNIYLTAVQAAEMYDKCDVRVLKTKSVAEGYSALSMMDTWAPDIDAFTEDMEMALFSVTSLCVTKAVHDASIDGACIKEGHYMGISDGKILFASTDKNQTVIQSLQAIDDIDEKEVVTIFYGEDVSADEADALVNAITENFPHIECGAIDGKQKLYDYYLAVE